MFRWIRAFALVTYWVTACVYGANSMPVVGPGATKEEVLNAYGWPTGQSQSGTKEILTYPQGRVTLENGQVEKVDFATNVAWPAPRPRPPAASPTSVKKIEAPTDFWFTSFPDAQKEAMRRNARILALFIGSDWSPPSKQFQDEVAFHPDFVNAFAGDFVFLRLDFPNRVAQSSELREQNAQLRAKYNVTTYPALLVLSPAGTAVGQIDLTKPQPGSTYRDRTIAAIREIRDLLGPNPPAPDPVPAPAGVAEVAAATPAAPTADATTEGTTANAASGSVAVAMPLLIAAVAGGLLIAGLGWWIVWGSKPARSAESRREEMTERIANAAEGVPTSQEVMCWPHEKLRAIVTALAESDSQKVALRDGGSDGDLALTAPHDPRPTTVVALQAGALGQVGAKQLKELFGTITVEDVPKGWFVAPGGFSKEARDYAAAHPIVLMDADDMVAQLRTVPPILLQNILARGA
jgi:hypothetical protein